MTHRHRIETSTHLHDKQGGVSRTQYICIHSLVAAAASGVLIITQTASGTQSPSCQGNARLRNVCVTRDVLATGCLPAPMIKHESPALPDLRPLPEREKTRQLLQLGKIDGILEGGGDCDEVPSFVQRCNNHPRDHHRACGADCEFWA